MRPLYEINNDILNCLDEETGEVISEEKLNALALEREQKIEAVACWYKNLKAELEMLNAEKKVLSERADAVNKKIAGLEHYLGYACEGKPFETAKCQIRFRKSKYLDIAEGAVIPDQCLEFQPPKVNKKAVKDLLGMGFEIEGASIKERTNINIK